MPYHITKGSHKVHILGYQPRAPLDEELADKMNVDETDPAKKYIRYEKANKKIDSLISHVEGKVDVIQENTIESLMYLSKNIEKIKYIHYDAKLKNRYSLIIKDLNTNFGKLDIEQIDKFLSRHGIYNNRTMTITINIIHWILFTSIYSLICYMNGVPLGLAVTGFVFAGLLGIFTNILFLCILDTSVAFYRLNTQYAALRIYNDRP
jgi:hypothetical protein